MAKRILLMPAYNEERTILDVLERAHPYVDMMIIVNDGSTDRTAMLVSSWAQAHQAIQLLTLPQNQGMSGALLTGFAYIWQLVKAGALSTDDVLINIDADGQHLPEEIPLALDAMDKAGVDVLLGQRSLEHYPWFKHVGNWGLSLWASLLSGFRYRDVECGFRLMRLAVLDDLVAYFTGRRYGCAQEIGIITARRGWKIHNSFPTEISYYRHGARVRDGVVNLVMGLLAFLRVTLRIRHASRERVIQVLQQTKVIEAERWLASS